VGAANAPPTCWLTAPDDASLVELGLPINVEGVAADGEQDVTTLETRLESDVDGVLFEGSPGADGRVMSEAAMLSHGEHILTLTVVDELGLTCADSRVVRVARAPVVAIAAPLDGDVINVGSTIDMVGTVADSDTDHGDLSAAWSSDRDGVIATGTVAADASTGASWPGASAGTHTLTLTGIDPDELVGTDSVTITLNQAPTAPTVRIDPDPAITTDDLVATVTGSVDPDGVGTLSYDHSWTRDGVAWSGGSVATVPAAATTKHETWEVTVTPTDGYATGPTGSASVTIANADPILGTPSVSPSADLEVGEVATCSAVAADPDGDIVSLSYAWVDAAGTVLGTGSTFELPGATVSPGGYVFCVVTADDGDGGTATESAGISVANSAPTLLSVVISPGSGIHAGDTLTCTAVASDPDGDTLSITYRWQNMTTLTAGSMGATYTVVGGSDSPGDILQCTAEVSDGRGGTDTGTDTVDVENSPPVITSVTITPTAPYNDTRVSCSATATDADGGRPSVAFTWTGPGGVIAPGAIANLTSSDIGPGQELICEATATDADGGTDTDSVRAVIANRAPTLIGVNITPDPAYVSDTLTCNIGGTTDADDDPVTLDYQWWAGSTMLASGVPTWPVTVGAGTTITCLVVPHDGHTSGAAVSDLVHLQNTPPAITSLSISPSAPDTDDTVSALVTAVDPDGDAIFLSYEWLVDGVAVTGGTSSTLEGLTEFDKGQDVAVTVTPRGPTTLGTAITSLPVTVVNTPPLAPTREITPYGPATSDDLVCDVIATAYDLDRDPITYSAVWTDATGAAATTSSATTFAGDTLPASVTTDGDTWTCTVTPHDGEDAGVTASASATVGCDADGDGVLAVSCGGTDCDDADATRYPGAGDAYGDGIDGDCDGMDCEAASDGASYFVVCPEELGSWAAGEAACQAAAYDGLASMETAAEIVFVGDLLINAGIDTVASPWIGLYESGGEGTWVWASGSTVVLTNWAAGQPDDGGGGGEDCAHINWPLGGLQWNDAACDGTSSSVSVTGIVCERAP
ncbi:MAG: lectin-like protein, partial [Myxococcota bacterium]|nr:lectin-like protein [Myxococcota bacterium]